MRMELGACSVWLRMAGAPDRLAVGSLERPWRRARYPSRFVLPHRKQCRPHLQTPPPDQSCPHLVSRLPEAGGKGPEGRLRIVVAPVGRWVGMMPSWRDHQVLPWRPYNLRPTSGWLSAVRRPSRGVRKGQQSMVASIAASRGCGRSGRAVRREAKQKEKSGQ